MEAMRASARFKYEPDVTYVVLTPPETVATGQRSTAATPALFLEASRVDGVVGQPVEFWWFGAGGGTFETWNLASSARLRPGRTAASFRLAAPSSEGCSRCCSCIRM